VVTALTMQVKFLIPAFWLALGISVLAFGPRDLLRRPMLWAGAGVTLLVTAPTLIWQARHGWPYLALTKQVSHEMDYVGGRYTFVPSALLLAGVAIGAVLACYGLWRLLRSPELAPYRFLGATTIGVLVIMIAANGRSYYAAGMYGLLWAVAASSCNGIGRPSGGAGSRPGRSTRCPRWSRWQRCPGSRCPGTRTSHRIRSTSSFAEVRQAGKLDNGTGVNNNTQGSAIWVCEGPRAPWPQLWPQLRTR
jgi:hypothetical protein